MGFMDKAKKMAEQAQAKLDEAQQQFNSGQGASQQPSGPAVEYDKHGRPIPSAEASAPESVAPPAPPAPEAATPPAPPAPEAVTPPAPPAPEAVTPPAPPAPPPPAPQSAAPAAPPAAPAPPAAADDEYAPPKLSSGDPLFG